MKLLSPETQYSLKETLRRVGVGAIIKLLVLIALFLWWIWPEDLPEQPPQKTEAQATAMQEEVAIPPHTATTEDLRARMTATQSHFYWKSFVWMMEFGKIRTARSFASNTLVMRYIKEDAFTAENGRKCIPFSEQIILAGSANTRKGIACQIAQGSWCRQYVGEDKAQCRRATPKGEFEILGADTAIEIQNLKMDWNNKLSSFGF